MDHSLWVEKYRPKTLEECVLPERVRTVVQSYVDKKDVPNLLFYGSAGTSKTTLAKALVNELGAEMLFIDASSDNGKQMITNSIVPFASTVSVMNQDVPKIILMDECLDENETVRVGTVGSYKDVPLKDLPKNEVFPVVSFNMVTQTLENDTAYVSVDKEDEVYEIELEDGTKIIANGKHPFICEENGVATRIRVEDGLLGKNVFTAHSLAAIPTKNKEYLTVLGVTKLDKTARVMDITVTKNHTFITTNGIISSNCDGLTFPAQQSLRPTIEQYSKNTRFIFTLNYPTKIIPAIKSRCVVFDFNVGKAEKPSLMAQFLNRVIAILEKEGITNYNKKVLALYIAKNFPDYRKIVNELQSFVSAYDNLDEGILTFGTDDIAGVLYPMIAKKEFEQMRKWILESSYSADDIFTALYTSMPLFVDEKGMQANYILILAKYQYQQGFVANQTLNLVACLTEMMIS